MIGLPPRTCSFCPEPGLVNSIWFDYAGNARYLCARHAAIPERDRNFYLLRGGPPS